MFSVDLRSDTVTQPTREMRRVIAETEVGDDVFAEDPTIRRLEERTAELLGKERALYVPSGTMANQIALAVLAKPGDEIFCSEKAHIFNHEAGSPSIIARAQLHPLPGERGIFTRPDVEKRLRPEDHHFPPSAIIEIENTSNGGGGSVWPLDTVKDLRALAVERGMRTHLDGARLFNAAVASGVPEAEWSAHADTVAVCFSKGLGAPVGSAIAGSAEMIEEAHRWRKRLGGGMRQAGIIAAGALYALEHHRELLADDHRRARRLAEELNRHDNVEVDLEGVHTNIVWLNFLDGRAFELMEALAARGIGVIAFSPDRMRLVTHLDVDDGGVERALQAFHELL
ncbi:MAG: L-allo-threonine aldolase [Calditrichaeota bacterium]|nr:L-allo-threonine aldolase [Calditrichota bacterium]